MLKKVREPILFQGSLNKKKYFEGWYYKQVSADERTVISFIPGVSLQGTEPHSFIQYILVQTDDSGGRMVHTGYVRYPTEAFRYQNNPFVVQIGNSLFAESLVSVQLENETDSIFGKIQLGPLHPIQTSVTQPNIMGFMGYIPNLECYHGVISMHHTLEGQLQINGKTIDFTGGKGYIEKDWGTSFPKKYIWIHSNQFNNPSASLFFSIADVPFHVIALEGFICNVVFDGREYRFATYNLSRCKLEHVSEETVRIRLENKKASLTIEAEVAEHGELIAPVLGTMEKTIKEGISDMVRIRLHDKTTGEIFEDIGKNAGVEVVDYV